MTDLQAIITQLEGAQKSMNGLYTQQDIAMTAAYNKGLERAISIVREHIKGGLATPKATKQPSNNQADNLSAGSEKT